MKTLSLCVELSKIRIDKYLADEIEILSRSKIKYLILSKDILVDGRQVKPSFILEGGEIIEISIPDIEPIELEPQLIPLDILYEDKDIILLNKPAGLVVHPGAGNPNGTLVNGLIYHFTNVSFSNSSRPGIVHRLDKDTSGIMVIAKNDSSHSNLSKQFSLRTVKKTYIALVWGILMKPKGIIDYPIIRHSKDRTLFSIGKKGRSSETSYRLIEQFEHIALVELSPRTGRTHQLRVHLSSIGHPIFSDDNYGGGENKTKEFLPHIAKKYLKLSQSLSRQALHAMTLEFDHPVTGKRQVSLAPMPNDIGNVINSLEPEIV
tara:strand:+ start:12706 stop:13662 length:957 start_codon:yes stop_codon:yes gene_type:complete